MTATDHHDLQTGLGKEAVRHYVRLNAGKVILACRSVEKGEAAKRDIEATTKRSGVVEVWSLDLGSYESVKQFAQRANLLQRLDIVLENAGVSKSTLVGRANSILSLRGICLIIHSTVQKTRWLAIRSSSQSRKRYVLTVLIITLSNAHFQQSGRR